jgi:bifunctional non-homologous end joining protein LigD
MASAIRMKPLEIDEPPLEIPARRVAARTDQAKLVEMTYAGSPPMAFAPSSFIALRGQAGKEVVLEKAETPKAAKAKADPPTADSFGIKISNADRVIYPGDGQTKGDLASYYAQIEALMMIDTGRRPISLVRCPQGRAKQCFFQKHDSGTMGEHVKQVPIKESDGKLEDYLYVEDARGILACTQMGTIEFHGWGCRVDKLENPGRLVFDLDPDEGLDLPRSKPRRCARDLLADLGLVTSLVDRRKGHPCSPLDARSSGPVKSFAEQFSRAIAEAEPEIFTANIRKGQRKGAFSSTGCATSAGRPP